jgi:hypothetical protein
LNGPSRQAHHGGLARPPRGVRVADRGKSTPKIKPKPKGGGASTKEINVIGTFDNPFATPADEVAAMKADRWSPSSDDFSAVAGGARKISSYSQLLSVILVDGDHETKDGSISRINIFTHANSDLLAFSGTISSSGLSAQVSLGVNSALSVDTLNNLSQSGVTFTIAAKSKKIASKSFSLDDVRRRFAKDAVIVIYACHSAMDGKFVQQIADTFLVKVRGFTDVIGYYPTYDDQPKAVVKSRRSVGIGYNSKVKESDFHALDSNASKVEKSPTP